MTLDRKDELDEQLDKLTDTELNKLLINTLAKVEEKKKPIFLSTSL